MKRLNQTAMQRLFLIPVAFLVLVTTLSSTSQSRVFGAVETSIQTSCINSQPCQTIACGEGQPCKVSETPNIDFDFEPERTDGLSQPLEGTGTGTGTDAGTSGLAPHTYPYNNIYMEDQEEYLEDRQDMIEDAEFE